MTVRILFGSETGNAKEVAHDLCAALTVRGADVTLSALDDGDPAELAGYGHVLVVAATTGDGEVTYDGRRFWSDLCADDAPRLHGVPFAVLGLGDTGYFDFCNAAVLLDERLAELGATRVHDLVRCDFDYETDATRWIAAVTDLVAGTRTPSTPPAAAPTSLTGVRAWGRGHPYRAPVLVNRVLTAPDAVREVRHVELGVPESDTPAYRAGDSLGVLPHNDPRLVDALVARIGDDPGEVLRTGREISRPTRELAVEVARRSRDPQLTAALADPAALRAYLWDRDVLDLLDLAPLGADELPVLLGPLAHRSYSIASSPLVAPDCVHLAVATLRYGARGRDRGGVCSTYLADRAEEALDVFLVPNDTFRLPADDVPVVMVGPGTGVAPFLAFLQERRATGARGRNWLITGNRHRRRDFLYGQELCACARDGLLSRLDTAFSRDDESSGRVYVQHRMAEYGRELYAWLAEGAVLYVCGDERGMARGVDAALHAILAEHGALSPEAAAARVDELRRTGRYLRDVY